MIFKLFVDNIFKRAWNHFFFLHTVKRFQVFLYNSNNLIWHQSFVCTHLDVSNFIFKWVWTNFFLINKYCYCFYIVKCFKYCYPRLIILFNIDKLFAHSEVVTSIAIGLVSRVFANGPGEWGSIPSRVIPKTQKMVLGFALLNTQHYKVRIKGKVEQSWEWSSALPYTSV